MIIDELNLYKTREQTNSTSAYHKTGVNDYQAGDLFLGITAPIIRRIAKKYYATIPDEELIMLLKSTFHDYRACALVILTYKMQKADLETQRQIVKLYIKWIDHVNSWDLVDVSAPYILGKYMLKTQDFTLLFSYAISDNLWKKRISIVSTWMLIRNNQFDVTLKIAEILKGDQHDLINKACGWMLREVGNRNRILLDDFIEKNYHSMKRTTLRYAIERHDEPVRKAILKGDFSWKQQ